MVGQKFIPLRRDLLLRSSCFPQSLTCLWLNYKMSGLWFVRGDMGAVEINRWQVLNCRARRCEIGCGSMRATSAMAHVSSTRPDSAANFNKPESGTTQVAGGVLSIMSPSPNHQVHRSLLNSPKLSETPPAPTYDLSVQNLTYKVCIIPDRDLLGEYFYLWIMSLLVLEMCLEWLVLLVCHDSPLGFPELGYFLNPRMWSCEILPRIYGIMFLISPVVTLLHDFSKSKRWSHKTTR